jgi:signal transduction histidine kinase
VITPLLTVAIRAERDVVVARQRSLQIARLMGFEAQDQVRIATAVSEIARNVVNYAGTGQVAFAIGRGTVPETLAVEVSDEGPGIADLPLILTGRYQSATGLGLGIIGARRLMDGFEIESGRGTRVRLKKRVPATVPAIDGPRLRALVEALARGVPEDTAVTEARLENQELLRATEELRRRQDEIARLNLEIEETNRGVLALYAEIDEKAESLRRADEVKSRFLSHMSHEFRTPLNSILAISRLLHERTDGELTPEQEKQVSFIRGAAQDLSELVNDLLDLAKVEAGKTVVRTTEFDVARMLGALRGMMRPLLATDDVRLVIEEPPPGFPPLLSDEAKVSQILRNFLSNAIKFTERGEVRLSVRRAAETNEAIFSVSDTGIGIAREDQGRIFDEFAQVENPVQRRVKGTGLGLALSRKLAELLGGSIRLESEPGRGSTFSLRLPLEDPVRAVPEPELDPAGDRSAVLVVDDDPASRYALSRLLSGNGITVAEAAGGADALQRIRAARPAAVVLDLVMPGMGGLEVVAALRADESLRDLPTVLATSKVLSDEERSRLSAWRIPVFPKSALGRAEAASEVRDALRRAGWVG